MSSPLDGNGVANTDRELWREREGDFYADSLHLTANGGIGINRGGTVIVKPLRDWFALASPAPSQTAVEPVAWAPQNHLDFLAEGRGANRPSSAVVHDRPNEAMGWNVPLYPASTLTAQAAALKAAERDRDELQAQVNGLSAKCASLAPHGECACSYDTPDDLCLHHSPKLTAAESEVATLKARIAELEAGLEPPYEFDRYVNGVLMAEGVTIEAVTDLAKATLRAVRIASRGPNGEAPVLVLRARRLTHQEKNNGR